jgi:hypothetical protein
MGDGLATAGGVHALAAAVDAARDDGTLKAPEPTPPKQLSAEDILGVQDLEILEVPVKQWGGSVYLRVLPADEGLALGEKMDALTNEPKAKQSDAMFLLLGACLVSADGTLLFSTPEQAQKLRTRSTKVLLQLQEKALALQGWSAGSPAKNV